MYKRQELTFRGAVLLTRHPIESLRKRNGWKSKVHNTTTSPTLMRRYLLAVSRRLPASQDQENPHSYLVFSRQHCNVIYTTPRSCLESTVVSKVWSMLTRPSSSINHRLAAHHVRTQQRIPKSSMKFANCLQTQPFPKNEAIHQEPSASTSKVDAARLVQEQDRSNSR